MADGRMWKRVTRRDRSLGPASEVRHIPVTGELERKALEASGQYDSTRPKIANYRRPRVLERKRW